MPRRSFGRQLRRAVRVRNWPLNRKIAVGAWIPVAIVALFVFTGPNRASSAPAPTTTTVSTTTTTLRATTTTVYPRGDVGLWIQGKGQRRRTSVGGSVGTVENQAGLQVQGHYLHLARKRADQLALRASRHSSTPQTLPLPTTSTSTP